MDTHTSLETLLKTVALVRRCTQQGQSQPTAQLKIAKFVFNRRLVSSANLDGTFIMTRLLEYKAVSNAWYRNAESVLITTSIVVTVLMGMQLMIQMENVNLH